MVYELCWAFCSARVSAILVMASILAYFDTALFNSVIICCTTVTALILSRGILFTFGAGTG
jgi:hypothetical protein